VASLSERNGFLGNNLRVIGNRMAATAIKTDNGESFRDGYAQPKASPIKRIGESIVLEAKVVLYQTTLPVSGIAAEAGSLDASYFRRLFKKIRRGDAAGVSPND